MCRHAAYVGPGIALSELMRDVDHSLYHQSFAARELITGTVCADGFGIGWYNDETGPEPGRYTSILPIWNDPNLRSMGAKVRAQTVMGAVRNATVEGSLDHANCAPFAHDGLLWSLNGFLDAFDETCRETVMSWTEDPAAKTRGTTDAEALLLAVAARTEAGLATAVQSVLRDVIALADEQGVAAYLNVLCSDGEQVIASRAGNQDRQNSLYHLSDGDEFPGAHVVASEPLYDDPAWEPVDPSSLVVLRAGAPPVRLRV